MTESRRISANGAPARTVVVGHGYWGKNIARNMNALGALHGVCDPDIGVKETVQKQYAKRRYYATFAEVLSDEDVQAVAISTPAATHPALAIEAMEAGLDVFVEKPLALTYGDGRRMVDVSTATGRLLMVGHLLEYHPAVVKLAELVRSGVLGRLQYIYSNRLNLGKFRRQENILWSFAPHDIAVMLRVVGEDPIEVVATGGAYLQPNVADVTVTNLLFDNGVRGHIFVSWLHPHKEQRLVVIGSEKMVVFNDMHGGEEKLILYDDGADWINNEPVPRKRGGTPIPCASQEPLEAELSHFLAAVSTQTNPLTDGYSGLRVLNVLQAAQRSLQTGGSRVPLFQPAPRAVLM